MSVKPVAERVKETAEMRKAFCDTLLDIAATDRRVVVLDADLMSSIGTVKFMEKYPDRAFDVGVQEANMMGIAAGLSVTGKIPFAHTFGPFATRRAFDQVFLSCGYNRANVRIMGSDPGVTAAFNGGTHMPFEDMGLMRNIPEAILVEPADNVQLSALMKASMDRYGLFYFRISRKQVIKIYEEGSQFDFGRAVLLREGRDLTIIASGIMVDDGLKAAEILAQEGINARVVDSFCWKPIDREMVAAAARETGAIVTAENHNVINGLGSAVAEVVVEECPVPVERVGVQDRFGQVGPVDFLRREYGLTPDNIVAAARRVLARKRGGCC
ncbi:MAG: transketolase family protein [Negativicutes bacterium]|nr:transketolase family protein [Negativicutes bacterium]